MKERLEAIIFSEGGEITIKVLLSALGISQDDLAQVIEDYNRGGRGTVLIMDTQKVLMRVAGEHAVLIEELRQDVQSEDVSKAGLEVLAIVLYSESSSLSAREVEHIRGVNSGYTLRQLTMRGFLAKSREGMGYQYAPTAELLSFLGVLSGGALPEAAEVQQKVREYIQRHDTEN